MLNDPHASLRDRVTATVLDGPAVAPQALRRAAATGRELPADLQPLVDTIRAHAHRVTDEDVARAQASHGDDAMFEVIVSAALGAAHDRLTAGLRALEEA
jgi:alkylhydroperoxidase family enzyme